MRCSLVLALAAIGCVTPPLPGTIDDFSAAPTTIASGATATLTWHSTNAKSCELSPDIGTVLSEGTRSVQPTKTTSYTLSCNGDSRTLTISVRPGVHILSFTANPATAVVDTPVTLSWVTENATNATCTLSPGGDVPGIGTQTGSYTATTTFSLRCDGFPAQVSATATVTIVPATNLEVPTNVKLVAGDGTATVSWSQTQGGTNVYFASEPGIDPATLAGKRDGIVFRKVANPFTVTGLVDGRTYYARVSAVSGTTETGLSDEVSATPMEDTPRNDPLFPQQWHLVSTNGEDVHVAPAWAAGVRGDGVPIAVVDEGIDEAHEDLRQNILTGFGYDYLGHAGVALAQHGTCVAGLLAARDLNGVGVRGVAPRAAIFSYNLLQDLTSANEYDAMARNKEKVFVSNNSWGDVDDGTGLLSESDPLWLQGVEEGTRLGRGGKGVLYFWASGNGYDSNFRDTSNYDGQANRRFVFAVSGVGPDGVAAGYAEPGANVLVTAPTQAETGIALTTTDITGVDGYNTGNTPGELQNPNYSQQMNGTSASTPLAAAVGALVLQVRPELSWRDVRRVLAYSARKNDPTDADWATNGAGLHLNHKYGYGVVDADAAVRVARTIVPGGPELSVLTPLSTPRKAIPDNDATGVSDTITVSNSGLGKVEFVEIIITIDHPRSADLEISLQRVGGANDQLHQPHSCQPDLVTHQEVCSSITAYPFGSTRHLDEPADGQWVLSVKDRRAANVGTFTSWQLNLFGRAQ